MVGGCGGRRKDGGKWEGEGDGGRRQGGEHVSRW